ncbi:metal ABC transporter ATP-binding protein [Dapis sp. BLCC M126]|uniref:metal ABC transporter ATP-binding protein n=1 Tax=Dapis sp. BLCC M126 TaxID=3400189 RepID=UPI003CF6D11C
MLIVQDLSVRYRSFTALNNVSFTFEAGESVGIIGPNGAGKSTMVKAMLGLIQSATGIALLKGKPLTPQLSQVAYVPQRSQIDWDYPVTVWNVAMMGRTLQTGMFRRPSTQSRELVKAALQRVGMYEYRDHSISDLSGGQQQRVFLARALAKEAELLILDEPFTGVDQKTESIMFDIFNELKAQAKILLVITHDLSKTLDNYDQLLLLNKHVVAKGPRHEVMTQDNLLTAYEGPVLFASA